MKVIFRCKRSGNTVSFSNPNDIEQLRKHEGYEEVKNAVQQIEEIPQTPTPEVKRRGRPAKQDEI